MKFLAAGTPSPSAALSSLAGAENFQFIASPNNRRVARGRVREARSPRRSEMQPRYVLVIFTWAGSVASTVINVGKMRCGGGAGFNSVRNKLEPSTEYEYLFAVW